MQPLKVAIESRPGVLIMLACITMSYLRIHGLRHGNDCQVTEGCKPVHHFPNVPTEKADRPLNRIRDFRNRKHSSESLMPTVDAYPDGAIGRGARYPCATAGSLPLCLGQRKRCEGNTPFDGGSCTQLGAPHT